jgi:signal transduction histidine kinase
MSQDHLSQALQGLKELQTQNGALEAALNPIIRHLEQALQQGEGQEAAELRESLQALVIKNSEFVSYMVHEVRKPMTSIRGYSDMLGKNVMGELNPMQTQFVATIRNNVISMEQLVTDLSDISKLKSGRVRAEAKMDMFKNMAMQLEKEVKDLAESRQVSLSFEVPSGLPLLNLDTLRANQALRKLIENALKYTPEGSGQVVVRAEGTGTHLKISVQDNGIGIAPEYQDRFGELFMRGDHEQVMQTKGYGLGIPIALECLKLIGGELKCHSTPDQGTLMEVYLPSMN